MDFETLLSLLIAGVFAPIVTQAAKRHSWPNTLTRAVSTGAGGLLGVGVWALQGAEAGGVVPALVAGLLAGAAAAGGVAGWKALQKKPTRTKRKAGR